MLHGCFTGVCVLGQSGFEPNTVVNCYGNDATCTGSFTTHTDPKEVFYNPCCFDISDIFDQFTISAINVTAYYTVSDGKCQSCTGKHTSMYTYLKMIYIVCLLCIDNLTLESYAISSRVYDIGIESVASIKRNFCRVMNFVGSLKSN